ncbi:MAG: S1C family serine protease [Acetobacteraceae bacterium]
MTASSMIDNLDQLSNATADRVAAAAPCVVAIRVDHRARTGILWRPDVVVTSEQVLGDQAELTVVHQGVELKARLAGRDPGTNVAVLRLGEARQGATLPAAAPAPRVGELALMIGADRAGAPTARLAMVHATGPAWDSMAGGRIDAMLRLDGRLGADEGGPVLDATGRLLGMSTAGPRRRTLVIPTATIERVLDPLLAAGRIARGWLGAGLHKVGIPQALRAAAGRETGMMVMNLAAGSPAEQAGVLPGDILLDVDGIAAMDARALAARLGPDRVGQPAAVTLLRAGAPVTVTVTVAARPA